MIIVYFSLNEQFPSRSVQIFCSLTWTHLSFVASKVNIAYEGPFFKTVTTFHETEDPFYLI